MLKCTATRRENPGLQWHQIWEVFSWLVAYSIRRFCDVQEARSWFSVKLALPRWYFIFSEVDRSTNSKEHSRRVIIRRFRRGESENEFKETLHFRQQQGFKQASAAVMYSLQYTPKHYTTPKSSNRPKAG